MVGYVPNGYKVWVVETGKFLTARDVIFDEIDVAVSRPSENEIPSCKTEGENSVYDKRVKNPSCETEGEHPVCDTGGKNIGNPTIESGLEIKSEMYDSEDEPNGNNNNENAIPHEFSGVEIENLSNIEVNNKRKEEISLRRSKRIKNLEKVSYEESDVENFIYSINNLDNSIPSSIDEIETRDDSSHWKNAIEDEINSHRLNKTWTIVDKPKDKNFVDSKWVFTKKYDECGNLLKYKARLVARGFTQRYLEDYDETFAPVARVASFRFLLAFANQFNLLIHHMDVKTALLNGLLKEEVYMKIPQGINAEKNKVCKLNKAIYGLKQAARCWFTVFEQAIKSKGFVNSEVDCCIYFLNRKEIDKNIYILLYVDDLIIASKDKKAVEDFKRYLKSKFDMVDLKEIKHFLGMRIERDDLSIYISQSNYIKNVLKKFNMENCKPVDTPMQNQINFDELNSETYYDAPCRQLIGCLMYIMFCTRPDISYAVNIVSRYSNKSNIELWISLKRILRYLKGSIDLKLSFKRNMDFKDIIQGFVDSDWGGSQIDRRSTTGFVFKMFENCTICWSTKKQTSVAASSTEAEYMALFESVREALWLISLSKSINFQIKNPLIIFEDNQGCISIAKNVSCHKRSKHIDIKYHFAREQVENKTINIEIESSTSKVEFRVQLLKISTSLFVHIWKSVKMPCFCKNKVERLQDKVLCILCKQFMHAQCYNIKKNEIDLIKNTFKCKSCEKNRRASLTTTPVQVIKHDNELVIGSSVAIHSLESLENNSDLVLPESGRIEPAVNQHVLELHDNEPNLPADNVTLSMLFAELCSIKRSNEHLKNQVSNLTTVNNTLLNKVDNLELLIRTKHCVCVSSNDNNNFLKKSLSLSDVQRVNKNHISHTADGLGLSKPVLSSSSSKATESFNSYASVAKCSSTNAALSLVNNNSNDLPAQSSTNSNVVANAINFNNNSWNLAGKKKKSNRELIGTDSNNQLGVIHKLKWLHISSFKNSVSEVDIINYLAGKTDISANLFKCFKLIRKGEDITSLKFVNFKIGISSNVYNVLLNPAIWPVNVRVRPFIFIEKKHMNESDPVAFLDNQAAVPLLEKEMAESIKT